MVHLARQAQGGDQQWEEMLWDSYSHIVALGTIIIPITGKLGKKYKLSNLSLGCPKSKTSGWGPVSILATPPGSPNTGEPLSLRLQVKPGVKS